VRLLSLKVKVLRNARQDFQPQIFQPQAMHKTAFKQMARHSKYDCEITVDSCIFSVTLKQMPFIQFPFIEVPKELHELVGEPTRGTRAYRREGTHAQCAEWFEALGEYYKVDVGFTRGRPQTHQGGQIDRLFLLHHQRGNHVVRSETQSQATALHCGIRQRMQGVGGGNEAQGGLH
jgi:hypothetical protein